MRRSQACPCLNATAPCQHIPDLSFTASLQRSLYERTCCHGHTWHWVYGLPCSSPQCRSPAEFFPVLCSGSGALLAGPLLSVIRALWTCMHELGAGSPKEQGMRWPCRVRAFVVLWVAHHIAARDDAADPGRDGQLCRVHLLGGLLPEAAERRGRPPLRPGRDVPPALLGTGITARGGGPFMEGGGQRGIFRLPATQPRGNLQALPHAATGMQIVTSLPSGISVSSSRPFSSSFL